MSVIKDAQKLLDILGVDLGEEWEYETSIGRQKFRIIIEGDTVYWETFVYDDGDYMCDRYEWTDAANVFSTDTLIDILTHPENIVHITPRQWTEQDADDVLAARRLFPDASVVERSACSKGEQLILSENSPMGLGRGWRIRPAMFPSVKVDDGPVLLDTIMEQYQKQQTDTVTTTCYDGNGNVVLETVTTSKGTATLEHPSAEDFWHDA